ncbi:hypothetical protein ACFSQE_18390 [Vogesella fluminis]|uniref:Type 4 fimbrial biogenesis protein PilX N-terminal domain-containing protein n=1 Tax=Vogesella fluminis TaxID=1069161 RepID=A0ABQ3H6M9_9NEIS|nr:hypothetical protein [Vogesella fluminis]GHD73335.1 hypothetical protein GCM10011419_08130 [Vogesella fluminis]
MATLTMSLVVLFIASLMVFYTSSGMLFEIKTGNNQLYQSKALEAARGGVEHSMAWLVNGSNTSSLAWVTDATGPSGTNQKATAASFPSTVSDQTIGDHAVAVSLWRNSAVPTILEVSATASGDASATIRQRIRLGTTTVSTSTPNTLNIATVAPIVINGGLSGVTGTPDVYPSTAGGAAIVTSSTTSSQIDTGHLDLHGGTISYGAFAGTAWDYIFPDVTKAQMKAAADYQKIFYYDAAVLPPSPWHQSIGTASDPVILIFDIGAGCPKVNGSVTIYGLVYYGSSCADNGWGGATIYGSMVADMSITKLNANAEFSGWSVNSGTGTITLPPTITTTTAQTFAKLAASWRDF